MEIPITALLRRVYNQIRSDPFLLPSADCIEPSGAMKASQETGGLSAQYQLGFLMHVLWLKPVVTSAIGTYHQVLVGDKVQ